MFLVLYVKLLKVFLMQALATETSPEFETFTNDEGSFVKGFLIGTKPNDARWRINPRTAHDIVQKFIGKDFAIIPELINTPLSEGGGGHYWGNDTYDDLLKGYSENSHGKYIKILGPYAYDDGTDDFFYNAIIKLRDSKAASELIKHGKDTWVPYSVSPHIQPRGGTDDDITDWEPIGGALVIKGAFGPGAVLSKLCKGTMEQCEKSLGGSTTSTKGFIITNNYVKTPCEKTDAAIAEKISSLVSKSASSQTSMSDNKGAITATNANDSQPKITELTAEVKATPVKMGNPTVDSQSAITQAKSANENLTRVMTGEEWNALQKEREETKKALEEQNKVITELRNDKKRNTLNQVFAKIKDDKKRNELVEKYMKVENLEEKLAFLSEINPVLSSGEAEREPNPEEEDNEDEGGGEQQAKAAKKNNKESKGGSSTIMTPEPRYISEESKAGSVTTTTTATPPNKLREILGFNSGGYF